MYTAEAFYRQRHSRRITATSSSSHCTVLPLFSLISDLSFNSHIYFGFLGLSFLFQIHLDLSLKNIFLRKAKTPNFRSSLSSTSIFGPSDSKQNSEAVPCLTAVLADFGVSTVFDPGERQTKVPPNQFARLPPETLEQHAYDTSKGDIFMMGELLSPSLPLLVVVIRHFLVLYVLCLGLCLWELFHPSWPSPPALPFQLQSLSHDDITAYVQRLRSSGFPFDDHRAKALDPRIIAFVKRLLTVAPKGRLEIFSSGDDVEWTDIWKGLNDTFSISDPDWSLTIAGLFKTSLAYLPALKWQREEGGTTASTPASGSSSSSTSEFSGHRDPVRLCKLGIELHQRRRFAEAMEHFDRCLLLDPDNVESLNKRGKTLLHLWRTRQAKQILNEF